MADTATAVDFSGDTNDFAGIQEDEDNRGNLIAAPSSSPASTGKDKDSSNSGKAQRPKAAVGTNGNPNNGGSNQGRRKPNPRYLMLEMPADKKTNSRAGIKRAMKLSSRLSQEMFYRTYAKVSDANYFMERMDRLLHHAQIVSIAGESYRLKNQRAAGIIKTKGETAPAV